MRVLVSLASVAVIAAAAWYVFTGYRAMQASAAAERVADIRRMCDGLLDKIANGTPIDEDGATRLANCLVFHGYTQADIDRAREQAARKGYIWN